MEEGILNWTVSTLVAGGLVFGVATLWGGLSNSDAAIPAVTAALVSAISHMRARPFGE